MRRWPEAKNSRLFKIERATMRIVGEYVYTLGDPPRSFRQAERSPHQRMMAIGLDRLIVLERTEQTTKLPEIELAGATNIAGSKWDDVATKTRSSSRRLRRSAWSEDVAFRQRGRHRNSRQDRRNGAPGWRLAHADQ
jgi:hypothetical protein